ncbi:kainate-selective ionotropic glutamate receptor-like protein 3 [Dermatophagoides farinae]|uniref:Kainate-selective ionotropic glutamate receptor-like protein 3 n=1 Tax=Dermatophagoides farinae TaxID=6954 RepID=A0A9D4P3B7_DERFA|nr:kainate-selective ionotropic glutamate receptor-like protein 3 [Dermatophagoides farinae]
MDSRLILILISSLIINILIIDQNQIEATTALPSEINIGAIFKKDDHHLLKALHDIVDRINNDKKILPRTNLTIKSQYILSRDSLRAAKITCQMLKEKVWLILTSRSDSANRFARSTADMLHIPHLSIQWDYRSAYIDNVNFPKHMKDSSSSSIYDDDPASMLIRGPNGGFYMMDPSISELSEALKDFVDTRSWKSFTLIYDSDDALIRCKDLLTLANLSKPGKPKIKVSVLNFVEFDAMARLQSKMLQKVRQIKSSEHNFILSLRFDRVLDILREAKKTKRMSEYDNYFIITMDLHMYDLMEFQNIEPLPNITALSVVSAHGQEINLGTEDELFARGGGFYSSPFLVTGNGIRSTKKLSTDEALIYDAMTLFARALDDLDRSRPELIVEPFVECDIMSNPSDNNNNNNDNQDQYQYHQRPWPLGIHIIDYMKNLHSRGVTGLLMFNDQGLRVNFTLDVLQLKPNGLKTVAKWTRSGGIISLSNYTFYDSYREILEAMKFKELLITVPPSSIPYVSLREDHENHIGNDKFYGYCVDLLQEIANVFRQDFQSDFKYSIQISQDGQYGRPDKETGEWNGMFGELIRHQADLAIADLTATYLRETAVDFTMPFMNLGIAILFKKPSVPEPEMFSFLKPFSVEVWLYLASAFLGISLMLWIMSRISPYEWEAPHGCDPEPMELCNQFSIGNSLWFTIGSLMQQGSDLGPRALSTRCLATIWWFFTLIIISSYTANLAASLTLSRMAPAISSVEDLAKQTLILYGCRKGGSTWEFFAQSNNTIYQRMFNTMESNPEVYINKVTDAIERVRKGGYAYLAESSTIEYLIQRRCDLIQVGNWLDNKGYGIATPPESPYRTPISNAITVLQDRGTLYQLKKRWWVEKGGGLCTDDTVFTSAAELKIENLGGVFLVLTVGVAIGLLCGFIEFVWKSLKIARDERESIGKLIWLEMFRICTGGGSSRPVFQPSSSTINMTALDQSIIQNPNQNDNDNDSPRSSTYRRTRPFSKISSFTSNSMAQFDNNNYYPSSPTAITGSINGGGGDQTTSGGGGGIGSNSDYGSPLRMRPTSSSNRGNKIMDNKNNQDNNNNASSSIMSPLISMNSTKSLNKLNNINYNGQMAFGSPTSFKSQQPYNMY